MRRKLVTAGELPAVADEVFGNESLVRRSVN